MDKIVSFNQINELTGQIRSLRKGFVTNFFWDDNKHTYWIEKGLLTYQAHPESILLIHQSNGFSNLYYIATNIEQVLKHLAEIPQNDDFVADIVIRGEDTETIDTFIKFGFEKYKHLFRMTHVGLMADDKWLYDETVVPAITDDIDSLSEALHLGFDPIAEQLPSKKKLSDYIDKEEILLIRDKEKICGFIIFEIVGVTWNLKYWYTSADYRNMGIGAKLMRASLLKAKDSKRQLLWVMSHNDNAIKRYEHYGFKREKMNDYVMIKRK